MIDEVFRVRHRVFAEEEGPPIRDGRLHDRFDELPTVTHFVAYMHDTTIRCIRDNDVSAAGTPPDEFFGFRPHFPEPQALLAVGSLVALLRDYRKIPRLPPGLFVMFFF